ncbi:protease Do-like 2 [Citrus sinensis]|uniref:Protease Do-like 2 n=1 Tax=Citrus sinensis TaxID=2711 RepID=A0ACB8ML95_CITSI|nr:protease Do-like 2 [Citrus sinensis]
MAIAVANYCFSAVTSSVKFSCSTSSQRRLATSHTSLASANHKNQNFKNSPSTSKSSTTDRKFPGRSKDGKGETERSQSTAFKSFGAQRKDKKEFQFDSKEQLSESGNLQDAAFLNAVVKVYCTHTAPDYSLPWQKQRQYTSTGRQVKVKRRGDDTKYVAKVLARGVDCDIALLSVESEEFWKDAEPLCLGHLPRLQDAVTVVGYPLGGDTISVTKGVVSRIEVTSYAHGSSELLGIQIDAAINPGNSGGPAFNDKGECIGVAFQVYRSEEVENIGYVIPTTVVSHFLSDYERNGKYTVYRHLQDLSANFTTYYFFAKQNHDVQKLKNDFDTLTPGFPCLGVLLQKLENPALRTCLKVPSNEGVLVRRVEPTSDANNILKEGDVIVSFDDVCVGSEGTVPFRSNERIAFRYLISQNEIETYVVAILVHHMIPLDVWVIIISTALLHRFAGDVAELGIIRAGTFMKVKVVLNPRVHLVPYHIDGGQPSYLIIAGLVFTPLSEPLIEEECDDSIGVSSYRAETASQGTILFGKVRRRTNGDPITACKDKYLVFEFEDNYLAVLEREAAVAASSCILKDYGIPSERSSDLLEPYVDPLGGNQAINQDSGDSPVSDLEIGFDGLKWA